MGWALRGEDSPLLHKPVAIMGATPGMWGTIRMQMAFHAIFLFWDMKSVYKPEVLVARAAKKFNKDGKLTAETADKHIRQKIQALKELIPQQAAKK